MTRNDIERMAVEAGGCTPEWDEFWELHEDALERFAALVAAAEREACARVCEAYKFTPAAEAIRARGKS